MQESELKAIAHKCEKHWNFSNGTGGVFHNSSLSKALSENRLGISNVIYMLNLVESYHMSMLLVMHFH